MTGHIFTERMKAIHQQLKEKRVDCLVVTKAANVTYTTGFLGEDSWAVITARAVYLVTDSRYTEQAQTECMGCRIVQRANYSPIAEATAKLVTRQRSARTIAIEKSTSLTDFDILRKHIKSRLKTVAGIIESSRSIKDSDEVAAIRSAASIAAKALKIIGGRIKPGMNESELAGMLDLEIRKVGATSSFDTIVAFGPNASRPHHKPTTRKLKQTDTILIDFGARYRGYCCDITRCLTIGRTTKFYRKVYAVVEQAQAAAIKTVKAGVDMIKVDAAAREAIRRHDLPVYDHGTGHGLGLEIHELPFIRAQGKGKLQAGQVITIEPGIYMPGKLGVRIEDDVLVTETGCKILTRDCPHDPSLLRQQR